MLNTLASREQVSETPSRQDGLPASLEEELRVYGCQLIQQGGILMSLYVDSFSITHALTLCQASGYHGDSPSIVSALLVCLIHEEF